MSNHPNRRQADYEIKRCAPNHYDVTHRGALVGHLDIHRSGYLDWSFSDGLPCPSQSTQRRLVRSVRNDR